MSVVDTQSNDAMYVEKNEDSLHSLSTKEFLT